MSEGQNVLYYGDNFDVLQRHLKDESVDLVYLDPPFNSNQSYNVLFAEKSGAQSSSQIRAFEDTWTWDQTAAESYHYVVEQGGEVAKVMQAFHTFLGDSNMMAYLSMMAPRLWELRRVLKPTGSLYLHCDPTASHYPKLLLDAVFEPLNFRNDIVWKRKAGRGETNKAAVRFGVTADNILFYARTSETQLSRQYRESNDAYIEAKFTHVEPDGRRYRLDNITSPSYRPNLVYEYKGHMPPPNGWAVSPDRMKKMDAEGRLFIPADPRRRIQRKRYLDELEGETVDSLWDDIPPINSQARERLGYPTQKPEALLERIIRASSAEGDTILDPFCGCGTTIAVAERLKRNWIGMDITHLAINLIKVRLLDRFEGKASYKVIGEPVSIEDADQLAQEDPYQFQWWALGLVGARPAEGKKGADKGIDGHIYFHDEGLKGKTKQIIFSVKAGKTQVSHLGDLRGVLNRENADIGVLISMQEPSGPMRKEAAGAGFYTSPWGNHPRLQLLTVGQLLDGKRVDAPPLHQASVTFRKAPKATGQTGEVDSLFDSD